MDLQNVQIQLEQNAEWQDTLQADNSREAIRYKFDNLLDLYKKLTEPGVNELFKQRWFDGYMREYNTQ